MENHHELDELLATIDKAKNNDPKAQNAILKRYWANVYGYLFAKIKNENDAEDLAIQTFTKTFSKLELYNADFDFKTWVISIAHNTMIDFIRKKRIQFYDNELSLNNIAEGEPGPEELLINKQRIAELEGYLDQLKPNYKEVIRLFYLEEKPHKEIAVQMGISISNVKVLIFRAKSVLSNIIERE